MLCGTQLVFAATTHDQLEWKVLWKMPRLSSGSQIFQKRGSFNCFHLQWNKKLISVLLKLIFFYCSPLYHFCFLLWIMFISWKPHKLTFNTNSLICRLVLVILTHRNKIKAPNKSGLRPFNFFPVCSSFISTRWVSSS